MNESPLGDSPIRMSPADVTSSLLRRIAEKAIRYVEDNNLASFDVFDALRSPLLDRITRKRLLLRRIAVQSFKLFPFNVRPLFGIDPMVHTKTVTDLLSIECLVGRKDKAKERFREVCERAVRVDEGIAWGLNFPYATRFVDASSQTPNLYNTLNAAHSLMDYYELVGNHEVVQLSGKIVQFVLHGLGVVDTDRDTSWIRYYPGQRVPNYNVNATAAAVLVRMRHLLHHEFAESDLSERLVNFLRKGQNEDGSWFYTATPEGRWVDGYHTGFILDALLTIGSCDSHPEVDQMLQRGAQFYTGQMFDQNGVPRYLSDSTYPIESQNCAQAIQTLARLRIEGRWGDEALLKRVVSVVLNILYDRRGFFYHQKHRMLLNRQAYFRWSQTPMILSLLHAARALEGDRR
jgi:polysaccharide biosynthesis protein VpsJ